MTQQNDKIPSLTIEYFEALARNYQAQIETTPSTVDMIAAFVPHCLAAGTGQEIVEPYLQAQLSSGAQGACFLHREDLSLDDLKGFVGEPVLDVISAASHNVKIALIDALYEEINKIENVQPKTVIEFEGTYAEKSLMRARKIVGLSEINRNDKVAIVGVVHDLVRAVIELGADVRLSDFRQADSTVLNLLIGKDTINLIKWADAVIVTGNILKTRTANEIFETAMSSSTKLTVFAMTGCNIAPRYLQYGVNLVTTESFPYYWFAGTKSKLKVYYK